MRTKKFRTVILWGTTLAAALALAAQAWAASDGPGLTPAQALETLKQGNARFVAGQCQHPNTSAARLAETAEKGQHPFATVVGCSDSRVPVERVFDQGVGDVFVVRVAGNVCAIDEIGSAEYGTEHLGSPVLVVLGHTGCGAVTAVVTDEPLHGNVLALAAHIKSAVYKAREAHKELSPKDLVPLAIEANVWQGIEDVMKASPIIRDQVKAGKLMVVGAIYDIAAGKVNWLGQHPQQAQLLTLTSGPAARGGESPVAESVGISATEVLLIAVTVMAVAGFGIFRTGAFTRGGVGGKCQESVGRRRRFPPPEAECPESDPFAGTFGALPIYGGEAGIESGRFR